MWHLDSHGWSQPECGFEHLLSQVGMGSEQVVRGGKSEEGC